MSLPSIKRKGRGKKERLRVLHVEATKDKYFGFQTNKTFLSIYLFIYFFQVTT